MNIIDYFDQVRIINLPLRKDRRYETESEFIANGYQINSDRVKFFDAISIDEAKGFPSPGVRGCFLSHLSVLEDAQKENLNNILVLEDDIQFSKKISRYEEQAIDYLKKLDWDILYFGHNIPNMPGEPTWKEVKQPMLCAHFYAINGKTLNKLTSCLHSILGKPPGHPDGGPMHYDGALNTFISQNPEIKAYYFTKNLGYQRPSKTDLHEVSILDKTPLLNSLIVWGRKIKAKYQKFLY